MQIIQKIQTVSSIVITGTCGLPWWYGAIGLCDEYTKGFIIVPRIAEYTLKRNSEWRKFR